MIIQTEVKGYFAENAYFYIDDRTKHGFLIDPGAQADALVRMIRKEGWTIEKILLTHGHFDHTGAVNELRKALEVQVYAYETADMYLLDTRMNLSTACGEYVIVRDAHYLCDGDIIALEADPEFRLQAIHTPGHTPDSVIYYAPKDGIAFVGDTIFKGSLGDTRYPGGKRSDLLRSIGEKIFSLPEDTVLYSGHSEKTTVGVEKRRYGM